MPYKKQKAIRSNKKDVIYDLMTDLGLTTILCDYFALSFLRISTRRILPLMVLGSSSTNSTMRGYL